MILIEAAKRVVQNPERLGLAQAVVGLVAGMESAYAAGSHDVVLPSIFMFNAIVLSAKAMLNAGFFGQRHNILN